MINARAETVAEKPAFRSAFKSRRCLIPASGFYEWAKHGARKQPYFVGLKSRGPVAFAGLWERWQPDEQGPVESCTILTTTANNLMRPIHDRMPVILELAAFGVWLGEAPVAADDLKALLRPAPEESLEAYPVSRHVNDPRHDDDRCLTPVAVE
jgi:putative SOS response-associated peptidase YedK